MPSLSVIVASKGRPTLLNTMRATVSQMSRGDELLIAVQTDCPWGHEARNQLMRAARGSGLLFIDDDDEHVPGALDIARAALAEHPFQPHIFCMRYPDGRVLWADEHVREGNVSTQMILAPRLLAEPAWGNRYAGDYDFIADLCERHGPPVWHREVIALIRPTS